MAKPTCRFCDQPVFVGLVPQLCEKHHELMMLISFARRREIAVNLQNLLKLRQNAARFKLREEDVPVLLQQVRASWKR